MKIQPVILCGGSGTRLWPASRSSYPKQFIRLGNGSTLFKETLYRADGLFDLKEPVIVSNEAYRFYAHSSMQEEGKKGSVILEPCRRNTAPAIALAAFAALEEQDALLLVLPSDHRFEHPEPFRAAVELARFAAEQDLLVTFGIRPSYPETGYGYIQQGEKLENGVYKVAKFYEKPALEHAKDLLSGGGCYWNSGIFFFKASTYLTELKKYAPAIWEAANKAWQERRRDFVFTRPGEAFCQSPANSIDYAVMERTKRAAVVPVDCGWSDLGSWDSFYNAAPKDASGNVCEGDVIAQDSVNCYLRSSGRLVAALGVQNLVVVETGDAVLIADRRKAQEVKRVVEKLKADQRTEADIHLKVFRPWGSYKTLDRGKRFQVKRIEVAPGEENSLQLHRYRAEHWIVVSGTAKVTVGGARYSSFPRIKQFMCRWVKNTASGILDPCRWSSSRYSAAPTLARTILSAWKTITVARGR